VTVSDITPPVIILNGNTITLWPPNHAYSTVSVSDLVASASDLCDPGVSLNSVVIASVSSDEPDNSAGDGNTINDIVIAPGCKSVQLRAERMGGGNGRVYTITFKVTDGSGNSTTVTAKVTSSMNE
jgi:endo-1,4-beta-xylanase